MFGKYSSNCLEGKFPETRAHRLVRMSAGGFSGSFAAMVERRSVLHPEDNTEEIEGLSQRRVPRRKKRRRTRAATTTMFLGFVVLVGVAVLLAAQLLMRYLL